MSTRITDFGKHSSLEVESLGRVILSLGGIMNGIVNVLIWLQT